MARFGRGPIARRRAFSCGRRSSPGDSLGDYRGKTAGLEFTRQTRCAKRPKLLVFFGDRNNFWRGLGAVDAHFTPIQCAK